MSTYNRINSIFADTFVTIILISVLDVEVLPLWSSGQSSWLQIQRSRVRLPVLPDFLRSSRPGTGAIQPREDN
jgi:hypothetical protein